MESAIAGEQSSPRAPNGRSAGGGRAVRERLAAAWSAWPVRSNTLQCVIVLFYLYQGARILVAPSSLVAALYDVLEPAMPLVGWLLVALGAALAVVGAMPPARPVRRGGPLVVAVSLAGYAAAHAAAGSPTNACISLLLAVGMALPPWLPRQSVRRGDADLYVLLL